MCHFSTRVDTNTSLHARSLRFISPHCLLVSWMRMCSPMWSPCWSQAEGDDMLEIWENFGEINEGSQVQVCSSPSRLSQERAHCCCHHKGAGTQADCPHPYLQLNYVGQPWPLSSLSCIHQLWILLPSPPECGPGPLVSESSNWGMVRYKAINMKRFLPPFYIPGGTSGPCCGPAKILAAGSLGFPSHWYLMERLCEAWRKLDLGHDSWRSLEYRKLKCRLW